MCPAPPSDTTTQAKGDAKDFWVNMPNLISHLKKVSEQKPQATYYNVDMLKYQVNPGHLITLGLQFQVQHVPHATTCRNNADLHIDAREGRTEGSR